MKKSLAILLALMLVLSFTGTVFAAPDLDPTVTITSDSGVYTVQQGATLNLTATSVMAKDNQDWELISHDWSENVTITGGDDVGATLLKNSASPLQFISYAQFSAVGKDVGLYDVEYEIRVMRIAGSQYGDGSDEVSIEVTIAGTIPVYVEPMAAPAVAAQILKYNDVSARYGNSRTGGNFIADVAHEMGPQTMFNDVEKEIWCKDAEMYVSNPKYWEEVLAFLNDHYNMNVELKCAYEWFVGMQE